MSLNGHPETTSQLHDLIAKALIYSQHNFVENLEQSLNNIRLDLESQKISYTCWFQTVETLLFACLPQPLSGKDDTIFKFKRLPDSTYNSNNQDPIIVSKIIEICVAQQPDHFLTALTQNRTFFDFFFQITLSTLFSFNDQTIFRNLTTELSSNPRIQPQLKTLIISNFCSLDSSILSRYSIPFNEYNFDSIDLIQRYTQFLTFMEEICGYLHVQDYFHLFTIYKIALDEAYVPMTITPMQRDRILLHSVGFGPEFCTIMLRAKDSIIRAVRVFLEIDVKLKEFSSSVRRVQRITEILRKHPITPMLLEIFFLVHVPDKINRHQIYSLIFTAPDYETILNIFIPKFVHTLSPVPVKFNNSSATTVLNFIDSPVDSTSICSQYILQQPPQQILANQKQLSCVIIIFTNVIMNSQVTKFSKMQLYTIVQSCLNSTLVDWLSFCILYDYSIPVCRLLLKMMTCVMKIASDATIPNDTIEHRLSQVSIHRATFSQEFLDTSSINPAVKFNLNLQQPPTAINAIDTHYFNHQITCMDDSSPKISSFLNNQAIAQSTLQNQFSPEIPNLSQQFQHIAPQLHENIVSYHTLTNSTLHHASDPSHLKPSQAQEVVDKMMIQFLRIPLLVASSQPITAHNMSYFNTNTPQDLNKENTFHIYPPVNLFARIIALITQEIKDLPNNSSFTHKFRLTILYEHIFNWILIHVSYYTHDRFNLIFDEIAKSTSSKQFCKDNFTETLQSVTKHSLPQSNYNSANSDINRPYQNSFSSPSKHSTLLNYLKLDAAPSILDQTPTPLSTQRSNPFTSPNNNINTSSSCLQGSGSPTFLLSSKYVNPEVLNLSPSSTQSTLDGQDFTSTTTQASYFSRSLVIDSPMNQHHKTQSETPKFIFSVENVDSPASSTNLSFFSFPTTTSESSSLTTQQRQSLDIIIDTYFQSIQGIYVGIMAREQHEHQHRHLLFSFLQSILPTSLFDQSTILQSIQKINEFIRPGPTTELMVSSYFSVYCQLSMAKTLVKTPLTIYQAQFESQLHHYYLQEVLSIRSHHAMLFGNKFSSNIQ